MQIGAKIRQLRIANQMTQEELADRAELSKGFISQIENDLTSPSINTLVDILQCLGTDLKTFFSDSEDKQIVFREKDYFSKTDNELKNTIEWVVPNSQKNAMEPIRMTLQPGGRSLEDHPHEGEEFGYVVKGSIEVHIGNECYRVNEGESFYFESTRKHYIVNVGESDAQVIWVSTPPTF
ncbi:MAG TPA: cupin domain-containing protein [Hungateiclostridium thermocellum]|jgi:transcriptional regulator with XRE-family HTH domain|uniref:Cupin 2 conserved barrel domain protein n=2 Tax=Acetivibrio thermocellus TaxID=1515 RepID=A3DDF7_ACET2|nr:XRE family transcriptional regulator [Acetivibrio thermocellus]CDG35446.1 XRE family transcriptional regulator [Acetivibrio thermocellus BC1]ABN51986.1 Cupin 2 conserved barrel domain protein [Acetivibrio thermocellus ATCC 27405]ADU74533.1 Cupin 2 conserved barrel domain protein [Acetivibrio thermocellus DSM 1313]ALX08476.1 transcriptional regulator, XRE family with cupin 2 sensor [Acetivibrio thermocellus AD2]ANV76225.1 transcriptional regulator, XRE family with cupin 2 sensor [Acetivibrio